MHPISFDKKESISAPLCFKHGREKSLVRDEEQEPVRGVGKDLQPWRNPSLQSSPQALHPHIKQATMASHRNYSVRTLQPGETNDLSTAFKKF